MMKKDDEFEKVGGTKMFLAPETWMGGKFKGKPVDIWALGVTFHYLAFGVYPFTT
jgi:serine/threonine protein kinase